MYPATIISTVLLTFLLFLVPKRYFLLPFVLAACFIPADQRVIVLDLDFTPMRLLVIVGFLQILLRGEKVMFALNAFDKMPAGGKF